MFFYIKYILFTPWKQRSTLKHTKSAERNTYLRQTLKRKKKTILKSETNILKNVYIDLYVLYN